MSCVQWNENFNVGIDKIDKQHHHLVDTVSHLCKVVAEGNDIFEVKKVFDDLEDYTRVHFATEERYFLEFDYPHTKVHVASHKEFKQKLKAFRKDFLAGNKDISTDMINFLGEWLEQHVLDHDREYIKCFHEHGLF